MPEPDCITTIPVRGNRVAKQNKCPDRLWDIKGASGVYHITERSTCFRNGQAKYKPGLDIHVVFGNWCDEVMVFDPRSEAFKFFQRGWQSAQDALGAGTQLSMFD